MPRGARASAPHLDTGRCVPFSKDYQVLAKLFPQISVLVFMLLWLGYFSRTLGRGLKASDQSSFRERRGGGAVTRTQVPSR